MHLFLIINYFPQHPFISKDLDSKPIRDLLLEYKADVVDEEVDEDGDVSISPECFLLSSHFVLQAFLPVSCGTYIYTRGFIKSLKFPRRLFKVVIRLVLS